MIWQACGRRGSGNPQKGSCRRCFCENGAAGRVAGRPGRGMGEEKELWCPAGREKTGKKRENPGQAGHGRRKRAVMPRRQRKSREEERKVVLGGAWRAKRSLWCPAVKEKTGKKRENPGQAGHEEQKEALIPRLPSTCQPEIRELL